MPADNSPQDQLTSVGVVIVNYNAGQHLLNAVASARREGITEIVVVDNGSSDDSIEKLLAADPGVELIRLPNPGFGAANNAGEKVLKSDIVFCINPDTVVHEGAIAKLTSVLNSDPGIAIIGPRLLNPDGSLYPSARSFPVVSNAVGHAVFGMVWPNNPWTRKYKRLDGDYANRQEVDWVSGSAMFARRAAFESVGGFDDAYFMYMEDTDLCWRLRQRGWKIVYEPSAVLMHVGGVSTGKMPYRMLKHHHRSAIRYNMRTSRGAQRVLLPVLVAGLALRLPVAWLNHYLQTRKKK